MKSGKTYICTLMIVLYLFFPAAGFAFVDHALRDGGLPPVECRCSDTAGEKSAGVPTDAEGEESGFAEHACGCSCHLPLEPLSCPPPDGRARLVPDEASPVFPQVYIPIFVPPQNLA